MRPVIMVIDDDRGVLNLLSIVLDNNGYSVITAPNGKTALHTLNTGHLPSLILTDYCMPQLNGYQLTEIIFQQNHLKNIPVVIVTGSFIEDLKLPKTDNYKGIIQKPFQINKILEIIDRLVSGHKSDSNARLA